MPKRDDDISEWFQSEAFAEAANDFWENHSHLQSDLPDFGGGTDTWCGMDGEMPFPTHPIHPTVQ